MVRCTRYKLLSYKLVESLCCLLLVLPSDSTIAESRTPHRTSLLVTGLADHLSLPSSESPLEGRTDVSPLRINAFVYGEGKLDISLPIRRDFPSERSFSIGGREVTDSTTATFMQGQIGIGGSVRLSPSVRVSPVALSVINQKLKITFLGRRKGSKGRQRLYTIHTSLTKLDPTNARVSSVPAHAARSGSCSTPVEDVTGHRHSDHEFKLNSRPELSAQNAVSVRVATLSTDADPEWYAKFGGESNAEILRVINTAEALFFRNFGITFRIVKQHTYTDSSPYSATRADYLLSQFVRNPENPFNLGLAPETFDRDVDLKHLFSGKNLESNVLGIAYIGSLCATPNLAYGATQHNIFDTTFGIFAHEISHSMGAFHDPAAPGTVMYPSISIPAADRYSSRSLSEIRGFLLRSNSCLSTETVDRPAGETPGSISSPVLAPRTLTLERRQTKPGAAVRLRGSLIENSNTPIEGIAINLVLKGTVVATTTTNRNGIFSFTLPKRFISKRGASVYVTTDDGETISKSLSISAARAKR